MAGDHLPKEVHATVFAINEALKAPISYVEVPKAEYGIARAVEQLNTGNVETLFVLGETQFTMRRPILIGLQLKQRLRIACISAMQRMKLLKPSFYRTSHYLESWGDSRLLTARFFPFSR